MSDHLAIPRARRITAWVSAGIAVALFATCFIVPRVFPPEALIGKDGATIIYLVTSLPLFGMTLGTSLGALIGRTVRFAILGTVLGVLTMLFVAAAFSVSMS